MTAVFIKSMATTLLVTLVLYIGAVKLLAFLFGIS